MNSLVEKMGGRKVAMSLTMVGVALAVTYTKGDVPENLTSIIEFIIGAFVLGNVGSKTVQAVSSRKVSQPDVGAQLEQLKVAVATTQETLAAFIQRVLKPQQ